jgi:hypothetical protein
MATAGRPVRFLAKSTLFGGPWRPLLSAAGAIPVYRRQDGAGTGRNEEAFASVAAALSRAQAVCLFPEGVSHSTGRLEPLRTGAARMAIAAVDAGVDLNIVAVGINLERKTVFRSRATVAYGSRFGVGRREETSESGSPSERVRELTGEIARHMRELLVEADPDRDAELVERVNRLYRAGRPAAGDAATDLARRKAIAAALVRLRAERPQMYETALIQLRRYDGRLRRFGLSDDALDWEVSGDAALRFLAREVPLAIVLGPLALAAAVVFAAPYAATALASRITRETDVTATAKVVAGAAVYPAWIALISLAAWRTAGPAGGTAAAIGLILLALAGLFAIERERSAWQTARSWLALRGAHRNTRAALQRRRAELGDVIEAINEWMTAPHEPARADHIR